MEPGHIYNIFTAKDETRVTLRLPRWEDLDELVAFINGLVDEGVDIIREEKVTRAEQTASLGRAFTGIKDGRFLRIDAEIDGHIMGSCNVRRGKGSSYHAGRVGIAISKAYRNLGIGTAMLETLIAEAKAAGYKKLWLEVRATNRSAQHVYEKV